MWERSFASYKRSIMSTICCWSSYEIWSNIGKTLTIVPSISSCEIGSPLSKLIKIVMMPYNRMGIYIWPHSSTRNTLHELLEGFSEVYSRFGGFREKKCRVYTSWNKNGAIRGHVKLGEWTRIVACSCGRMSSIANIAFNAEFDNSKRRPRIKLLPPWRYTQYVNRY